MQSLREQAAARLSPAAARRMKHSLLLVSSPFVISLLANTQFLSVSAKIGLGMLSVLSYAYYYWNDTDTEEVDTATTSVKKKGSTQADPLMLDSQISELEQEIFGENLSATQKKIFEEGVTPPSPPYVEIKKSEANVAFQRFPDKNDKRQISTATSATSTNTVRQTSSGKLSDGKGAVIPLRTIPKPEQKNSTKDLTGSESTKVTQETTEDGSIITTTTTTITKNQMSGDVTKNEIANGPFPGSPSIPKKIVSQQREALQKTVETNLESVPKAGIEELKSIDFKKTSGQNFKRSLSSDSRTSTSSYSSKPRGSIQRSNSANKFEGLPGSNTTLTLYTKSTEMSTASLSTSRTSLTSSTTNVTQSKAEPKFSRKAPKSPKSPPANQMNGGLTMVRQISNESNKETKLTAKSYMENKKNKDVQNTAKSYIDRQNEKNTMGNTVIETTITTETTDLNQSEPSITKISTNQSRDEIISEENIPSVATLKNQYLSQIATEKVEAGPPDQIVLDKDAQDGGERYPRMMGHDSYPGERKTKSSSTERRTLQNGSETITTTTTQYTTIDGQTDVTSSSVNKQSQSRLKIQRPPETFPKPPSRARTPETRERSPLRVSLTERSSMRGTPTGYFSNDKVMASMTSDDLDASYAMESSMTSSTRYQEVAKEEPVISPTVGKLNTNHTSPFRPYTTEHVYESKEPINISKDKVKEAQKAITAKENYKNSGFTEEDYFRRYGTYDGSEFVTEQTETTLHSSMMKQSDQMVLNAADYDGVRSKFNLGDLESESIVKKEPIAGSQDYSNIRQKFLEEESRQRAELEEVEAWRQMQAEKQALHANLSQSMEGKLSNIFNEESVAQYHERHVLTGRHQYQPRIMRQVSDTSITNEVRGDPGLLTHHYQPQITKQVSETADSSLKLAHNYQPQITRQVETAESSLKLAHHYQPQITKQVSETADSSLKLAHNYQPQITRQVETAESSLKLAHNYQPQITRQVSDTSITNEVRGEAGMLTHHYQPVSTRQVSDKTTTNEVRGEAGMLTHHYQPVSTRQVSDKTTTNEVRGEAGMLTHHYQPVSTRQVSDKTTTNEVRGEAGMLTHHYQPQFTRQVSDKTTTNEVRGEAGMLTHHYQPTSTRQVTVTSNTKEVRGEPGMLTHHYQPQITRQVAETAESSLLLAHHYQPQITRQVSETSGTNEVRILTSNVSVSQMRDKYSKATFERQMSDATEVEEGFVAEVIEEEELNRPDERPLGTIKDRVNRFESQKDFLHRHTDMMTEEWEEGALPLPPPPPIQLPTAEPPAFNHMAVSSTPPPPPPPPAMFGGIPPPPPLPPGGPATLPKPLSRSHTPQGRPTPPATLPGTIPAPPPLPSTLTPRSGSNAGTPRAGPPSAPGTPGLPPPPPPIENLNNPMFRKTSDERRSRSTTRKHTHTTQATTMTTQSAGIQRADQHDELQRQLQKQLRKQQEYQLQQEVQLQQQEVQQQQEEVVTTTTTTTQNRFQQQQQNNQQINIQRNNNQMQYNQTQQNTNQIHYLNNQNQMVSNNQNQNSQYGYEQNQYILDMQQQGYNVEMMIQNGMLQQDNQGNTLTRENVNQHTTQYTTQQHNTQYNQQNTQYSQQNTQQFHNQSSDVAVTSNRVGKLGKKMSPARALDPRIRQWEMSLSEPEDNRSLTPNKARRPFSLPGQQKKNKFGHLGRAKSYERTDTPASDGDFAEGEIYVSKRTKSPAFTAYQERIKESQLRTRSASGHSRTHSASGGYQESPYSSAVPSVPSSRASSPSGSIRDLHTRGYSAGVSGSSRASSPGGNRTYDLQRSVASRSYNQRRRREYSERTSASMMEQTTVMTSEQQMHMESSQQAPADDKIDEGLGNLPNIKSIKNRFESPDSQPAVPRSRKTTDRSDDGSSSVNGDARGFRKPSKWDRPKEPPPAPVNRRLVAAEDAEEEVLPQSDDIMNSESTSALKNRYMDNAQRQESVTMYSRKPVHKITPPRDELGRGIEEAQRLYAAEEEERLRDAESMERTTEELPPPQTTKNLLAQFRSMEDDSNTKPPPSPARSSMSTSGYSTSNTTSRQHTGNTTTTHVTRTQQNITRTSPDSGISEIELHQTESHAGVVMASQGEDDADLTMTTTRTDILRESDKAEEELPERGFTKSLVGLWKQKESESTYTSRDVSPAGSQTWGSSSAMKRSTSGSYRTSTTTTTHHTTNINSSQSENCISAEYESQSHKMNGGGVEYDQGQHSENQVIVREGVIRESDRLNEVEELPPSGFSKNMRAKFQTMQNDSDRERDMSPRSVAKKQFRWTVKEAKPIHIVSTSRRDRRIMRSTSNDSGGENGDGEYYENGDGSSLYEDELQADVRCDDVIDEPLPASDTTRSMLHRFRSMEESGAAPPTPEYAEKKMKVAYQSPVRKFSTRVNNNATEKVYKEHDGAENINIVHEMEGYQNPLESGEYENDPIYRDGVLREGDALHDPLPEQGTTRHLLARFRSIES